jgi:hypothetical protein
MPWIVLALRQRSFQKGWGRCPLGGLVAGVTRSHVLWGFTRWTGHRSLHKLKHPQTDKKEPLMTIDTSKVEQAPETQRRQTLQGMAGILAGMAQQSNLSFHPVYLCLAIGSGAKLIPWMNDAGFWIMCQTSNFTETEALKTITPMQSIMGITGLVLTMLAAWLFPMI